MLSYTFGNQTQENISLANSSTANTVETIAGTQYVLFLVDSGMHTINAAYVPEPTGFVFLITGRFVALIVVSFAGRLRASTDRKPSLGLGYYFHNDSRTKSQRDLKSICAT